MKAYLICMALVLVSATSYADLPETQVIYSWEWTPINVPRRLSASNTTITNDAAMKPSDTDCKASTTIGTLEEPRQ